MLTVDRCLDEVLTFDVEDDAGPREMQKVRNDETHTFAAAGGRDHHGMGETVGRRHDERCVRFRRAQLAEDETVLVEAADHLVALQLAPGLEMRVVILVEPSAMDASEPDQSEGDGHRCRDDHRALQRCWSCFQIGPRIAEKPGTQGAERIEALAKSHDDIDRCQHSADVEARHQTQGNSERIPPGGFKVRKHG